MEQAQYWTWSTKRKHSLSPHLQASTNPSYDDSWEEQAFAEDAAGALGGCVWPPRSYSCTFCKREFRSAQALGGHMNVHRRDRARLKQSPSPQSEIHHHGLHDNQNRPLQNPYTSLGFQYPSQICTLVYSPNTSSDPGIIASPSSPSRVSATTTRENCSEKTFFPPFSPSIRKDHQKITYKSSSPSRPTLSTDRYHHIPDLKSEGDKNSRILESECRAKVDYLKTDLSVSLNLVVRRTRPTISDGEEDEEQEESRGHKKRKTDASSLPFFLKSKSSGDRRHLQPEIIEISPCSFEELDLELRLGDRPKAMNASLFGV